MDPRVEAMFLGGYKGEGYASFPFLTIGRYLNITHPE